MNPVSGERACTQCPKSFFQNCAFFVLEHPLYSPDLLPRDFYLFPNLKQVLMGRHILSIEQIKTKSSEFLRHLPKTDDPYHCLNSRRHLCSGICIEEENILIMIKGKCNLICKKSHLSYQSC